MRVNRSSGARWSTPRRMVAAIWMTLAICLSAGCGKRVEYLNSDHKLTRLKQGQAAPRSGVLISEGYLSEIYEALGRPNPNAEILDSKAAPAASGASAPPVLTPSSLR